MKLLHSFQILLAAFLLLLAADQITGQETPKYSIGFSGMVKTDYMLDTRQTVAAREGQFLFFPAPRVAGPNGKDLNAVPNFNSLAIQSKLRTSIAAPSAFGMEVSGAIEAEFFGHSNADINGFRLRHAYLKLSGKKADILFGQYWHPLFVTACFPGVYSVDTGSPFTPFNRSPQIRLETKGTVRLIAVAATQRDFASRGPLGTTSAYLRNGAIPNLNAQVQFSGKHVLAGAGVDYKSIVPRTIDLLGNATRSRVNSAALVAYAKLSSPWFTWKAYGILGQNLADQLMLGGIVETAINSLSGAYTYAPIKVVAAWTELSGTSGHLEWGVFLGYTKNLGIEKPLTGEVYALGDNIDYVYRLSPRIGWKYGKTKLGIETEYTVAQYGHMAGSMTEISTDGIDPVANLRILGVAILTF
jgi:hypothetical protein